MASNVIGKCSLCHKKPDICEKFLTCGICKNSCHSICEGRSDKEVATILNVKDLVILIC